MSVHLRLPLKKLRVGMYIVDLTDRDGHSDEVYSIEGYVLSQGEVRQWAAEGYSTAVVCPLRTNFPQGFDPVDEGHLTEFHVITPDKHTPEETTPAQLTPFADEIKRAFEVRAESVDVAQSMVSFAAKADALPLDRYRPFFEKMVACLRSNEYALMCIGKLHAKNNIMVLRCVNAAALAVSMSKFLKIREEFWADIALCGFLYDIGKLFVPQACLAHKGKLDEALYREVQRHALYGHDYLKGQPDMPRIVCEGALDHHERFSGSGYPNGKKGMDISLAGRLFGVVDVYDALSSKRTYKDAAHPSLALSQMYTNRNEDFSPGYVETLIRILGIYPPGSIVRLSTNQLCVVTEANTDESMLPKVMLLTDSRGLRVRPRQVDLSAAHGTTIVEVVNKIPPTMKVEDALQSL